MASLMLSMSLRHYGLPNALYVAEALWPSGGYRLRSWQPIHIMCMEGFHGEAGVTVSLTSKYRPPSNGLVERMNQELGRFLRIHCQDRQGEWARFLP